MVYTFYSFKGGVGRSMALANIAECFHERGLRVLVVDWDLEAPGLETYFIPPSPERDASLRAVRSRPGLIDLLGEYQKAYPRIASRLLSVPLAVEMNADEVQSSVAKAAAAAARALKDADDFPAFLRKNPFDDALPASLADQLNGLYRDVARPARADLPAAVASSPLGAYVQSIHPPEPNRRNGLFLLSAGARDAEQFAAYAKAVQEFDWAHFYAAFEGHEYFSWFRKSLRDFADVVLIDSRTGVTEMGGVCTRHLADAVVAFCAPNSQNLDGVLRVMRGVNRPEVKDARGGDRHVDIVVIPARVDLSESDRLNEFSETFAAEAEQPFFVPAEFDDIERPFRNLQIPYIPRYNYGEERVLGPGTTSAGEVGKRLLDAYTRIAVHIAALAPVGSVVRIAFSGEIATTLPNLEQPVPQMAPSLPDPVVRADDVRTLVDLLTQPSPTPGRKRLGVWGGPGSGKTTLVAAACHDSRVIEAYSDGILWLTPDRQWTGEAAHAWLRTNFRLGRSVGTRALRHQLESRKFLIVADDVWDLQSVAEVLTYGGAGVAQIVISRDLEVASSFGQSLLSVEALKPAEHEALLPGGGTNFVAPDDPTHALAVAMLEWPLGASLVRATLERRLAMRESSSVAWEKVRHAFARHRVLAFDTPGSDRSTSAGLSLAWTLSRLTPAQRALLVRLAERPASDGLALGAGEPDGSTDLLRAEIDRLCELGLARFDDEKKRAHISSLVQAYLLAQGELKDSLAPPRPSYRVSSSEDQKDGRNRDVEEAKRIIRGQDAPLTDIRPLAERLKSSRYFDLARRLFAIARQHRDAGQLARRDRLQMIQRHALCTYRDPDLPIDRFEQALAILSEGDLSEPDVTQETLGLAGAVHKYRWRHSALRRDLEESLEYYRRGHQQGVETDFGYTAINAAFVLDLLAAHGRRVEVDRARDSADARAIREEIVTKLPALALTKDYEWLRTEWWFHATLAEAFFGLGRHEDARFWLREGLALSPPDWEVESTTRQLAALAYAQDQRVAENSEPWRTLRVLVGSATAALHAMMHGKIGLALSGGGFRASLFHIGVLARLAELDVLRHVEVLSCVSGGSIVGAHYYLEVRKLLAETPDAAITREHYIAIVERLEREFLAGVQQNLRTRLFVNWWANLRTLVDPAYTRTTLLGALFERHLYSRVADGENEDRYLSEMYIRPTGEEAGFNPKLDNWRRAAKGPILLLNATTLNTGHNWQFAVSWMGEPPIAAGSPIDGNDVMRRVYYWEAPKAYHRVRLGRAVAASACVPALFDPVELDGLFPKHAIRLVDGGVHDNQGVAGLLEQECTIMLVSDASGQSNTVRHPSVGITAVPARANDILMSRVREAEFRELDLLRRSGALNGLMFLHLKKDLTGDTVDWIGSPDPHVPSRQSGAMLPLTTYGTQRGAQEALAGLRTDLDSFSDTEAYALMASGYKMADFEFPRALAHWPAAAAERREWKFQTVAPALTNPNAAAEESSDLVRHLRIGSFRSLKIWRLAPPFLNIAALALAAVLAASAYMLRDRLEAAIGALRVVGAAGVAFAFAAATLVVMHKVLRTGKGLGVIVTGMVMITVGWIAAGIHLLLLDPLFLLNGAVDKARARRLAIGRFALGTGIALLGLLAALAVLKWRASAVVSPPPLPTASVQSVAARARVEQTAGNHQTAAALWNDVLANDPGNREALEGRAEAAMQVGDFDTAIRDYTATLAVRPTADVLRARAHAYRQSDRLNESRDDLERALSMDPGHQQTVQDLRYIDYLLKPRGGDARLPARLYVNIADARQLTGLERIRMGLVASILVQPTSLVKNAPNRTELRYTHAEDVEEARAIARQLGALGLRVGDVKLVTGGGRPRHFELWLSRDVELGR